MKKGQVFETPFMYLFIIILLIVAAFFGIKMVVDTVDKQEDIEIQEFFINFNTKVQKAYLSNPGVRVNLEFVDVPLKIEEICFIDYTRVRDFNSVSNLDFRIRLDNVTLEDDLNFFIYGEELNNKFKSFKLENVKISSDNNNPLCELNNNGTTKFKAVSTLGKAELSIKEN